MSVRLTLEERETHLNMVASDRKWWIVFSDDPVMIKKLKRVSDVLEQDGEGCYFRLHRTQVSFRKLRKRTQEETEMLRERARENFGV